MTKLPHSDFRLMALEQTTDELFDVKAQLQATEDHLVSALQDSEVYRAMVLQLLATVADLTARENRRQRIRMRDEGRLS